MPKKRLIIAGCSGLLGTGLAALLVLLMTRELWYHPDLWFKKLNQRARVELDDLAGASLPPTFRCQGLVNSGARAYFDGDTVPPERHFDDRQATWRFVQGQFNDTGGHRTYPAILDVTLFNPTLPEAELLPITATTVGRFYSNMESTPPFAELEWTRVDSAGGTETRALAGRDVYTAGHPERWLVIHVDPARRARVDLYVWKSAYRLDEAWQLARTVAATLEATPRLLPHFESVLGRRQVEVQAFERELELRFGSSPAADSAVRPGPDSGSVR